MDLPQRFKLRRRTCGAGAGHWVLLALLLWGCTAPATAADANAKQAWAVPVVEVPEPEPEPELEEPEPEPEPKPPKPPRVKEERVPPEPPEDEWPEPPPPPTPKPVTALRRPAGAMTKPPVRAGVRAGRPVRMGGAARLPRLKVRAPCAFPSHALHTSIDEAVVVLRVTVARDGRVKRVRVVRAPGPGFADAAKACTFKNRFVPARDERGQAIPVDITMRVVFRR